MYTEEEDISFEGEIPESIQKENLQKLKSLNIDLPFDIDTVDPYCHECVLRQLDKYNKHVDRFGKSSADKFIVPCEGICVDYFDKNMRSGFTDDEWDEVKAQIDIVYWAEKYIKQPDKTPWSARWYQKNILRCTSRRKMLRISRRSGKTDMTCVDICHKLFTKENYRIVIASPQKVQTEEIVNRVRAFIASNPALADCVVRDVSAPYYNLKISNKSELRGFAAGGTKGGDGSSIRGQDCDSLYLEEMDYIAEQAISSAVLPLLQTKEGTFLIGFSTPSGLRTPYYSFCTETPEAKEFHYSYKVLPHWKAVEADRTRYTEEEWNHEFLALFGSSDSGVYKPEYIDAALTSYKYADHQPTQGWKYCMGTDWNEKYGTEIFILGWNPFKGKYFAVESMHIEPTQFTQLEGVNRVLELNRKWRPDFIYIDAGNGSTNSELLFSRAMKAKKTGTDEPTANLLKTLKRYDSGSAIQTKDLATREMIKKPAKAFMVNASVRMFEQGRIHIPTEDTRLDKQLRNYIIERYTPNGTPVYGQNDEKIGDHRLDALNLAIVAFHLEFDELHATGGAITNVAAAADPRKIKMLMDKESKGEEVHRPEERRLDANKDKFDIFFIPTDAGKLNKTLNLKTNRLGWSTDQEELFLQRARSRQKRSSSRPDKPHREKF